MKERADRDTCRGISEVLGTVLIFSIVILVSIALLGFGFQIFSSGSEDVADRQGQDALHETADRLDTLASSSVEQGTEITIPDRADIEALPEEGTVNITVETHDHGGSITPDDIAADSMVGWETIKLGTLHHETADGVETVYQGGLFFEREGPRTQIHSRSGFDYDGKNLAFSFVSISDMGNIGGGSELFAERDFERSERKAETIQEMIQKQRTVGDDPDDPIAYADINITVTIQTAYPEAWKKHATERMTVEPQQIVSGDDRIQFVFTQFAKGDIAGVGNFTENVLYTGTHTRAHDFFNGSLGTISEMADGFNVEGIDGAPGSRVRDSDAYYGLAVVDGGVWKIADFGSPASNVNDKGDIDWVNVKGNAVGEPTQLDAFSTPPGGNEDEWQWGADANVCLVASSDGAAVTTEDMRHAVAEGDCEVGAVGADEGDLPDMQAIYELAVDVDQTTVNVGDKPTFDVNVTNVGNAYGDRYVYLAGDFFSDGTEIAGYERIQLYPGESDDSLSFEFTATASFNDAEPVVVSAGNGSERKETDMTLADPPVFKIDDLKGADAYAEAGEEFEVNATINNPGGKETQVVVLKGPDGAVVDGKTLTLENETRSVSLPWDVPPAGPGEDVSLTVETEDDSDSLAVDREPVALITDLDVDVDNSDDEVTVEATVENPSDQEFEDATIGIDAGTDLIRDGQTVPSKTVDIDGQETVTFNWDVTPSVEITDWVTVETPNDSARDVGVLDRSGNEPDCSGVTYDGGDGSDSDPYQISNVDQLQCIEDDLSADYELVEDVAAHGTKHWNGGDGFEPIGEQFDGQGGDAFEGDFDGNKHKIEGLTIDRYDEPFVGIFAITAEFDGSSGLGEGVTIENLRLVDIDVRGMTVVGGLVGGAGGEFREISVDGRVESQYQQVGGLIGHGHDADLTNELVSTATVIGNEPIVVDDDDEHPWQETTSSPNLGIGGILGGMGFDTQFSTGYSNANVEGPSSVGGITGWTSNNPSDLEQMYWADGTLELVGDHVVFDETDRKQFTDPLQVGGIAGRIGEPTGSLDTIRESVYSEGPTVGDGGEDNVNDNSINLAASEMTGPQVLPDDRGESFYENYPGVSKEDAEGTMANLDWNDTWAPVYDIDENGEIVNEGLPVFQWQVAGELIVTIDDADDAFTPGAAGKNGTLNVTATVENPSDTDRDGETITLVDPIAGRVVDSVTRDFAANSETTVDLSWDTTPRDAVDEDQADEQFIVRGPDTADTEEVDIKADTSTVSIETFTAPDRVEALEELQVNVTVRAEGFDLDDGTGTEVALRAGDRIVSVADSLEGGEETVKLTWTPTSGDIGNVELTADVLNRDASKSTNVQVVTPADLIEVEQGLPLDIDLELIGTN
jgi:hypothetical protein